MNKILKNIFSVTNKKNKKILTIFGLKLSWNQKNKAEYESLLNHMGKMISQNDNMLEVVKEGCKEQKNILKELKKYREIEQAKYNATLIKNDAFPIVNSLIYVPDYPLDYIQRTIVHTGSFYEINDLKYLDKFINNNSVVLDIGANIGNHTVYWGKRAKVKKIYAFEPIKSTFERLQKNVEINGLKNVVKTYNVGISNVISKGKISVFDPANCGGSSILAGDDGDFDIITIDSLHIDEDNISLVKIDTEGFEYEVLLGALETIKKYKPYVYVEVNNKLELIEKYFENIGYAKGECVCKENYLYKPF